MPGDRSLSGLGVSPGIAFGPLVPVILASSSIPPVDDPAQAVRDALTTAEQELNDLVSSLREQGRDEGAEVLAAQSLMAADPMLLDGILEQLGAGAELDDAITATSSTLQAMLEGLGDPYLAQRADDVGEVAERVRRILAGVETVDLTAFDRPVVLVANSLTAAETAQLDPEMVLGFATETGGPTSHVVIIARALGVPAVVGASGLMAASENSSEVALDGATGQIVFDPDRAVAEDFADRAKARAAHVARVAAYAGVAVAYGEEPVAVAANVASPADLQRAVDEGADGIGLLRTEFLFLDRADPPSEDEQYEFYATAARSFDHPVVIRSFDIGGDKPAPYMQVDEEENPFLGVRGARLYSHQPEAFETQVRAVLRAAAVGSVQLMLPMISTVDEVVTLRSWIDRIASQVEADGAAFDMPDVGVMVEVPAAALVADALMKHVDFVSIGSNDLTQYTLAADRTNGALGHLQDPLHPAVLALCVFTANAARTAGVPASVCGLVAADSLGAAACSSMGIGKLSVSASMVNSVKATISSLDPSGGHAALELAIASSSATEARAALAEWVPQ